MRKFSSRFLVIMLIILMGSCSAFAEKGNISGIFANPPGQSSGQQDQSLISELDEIPKSTKRTVMVYLCGSNLEEDGAAASRDILEMAGSGFNPESVNVLVMTGGSRVWRLPAISSEWSGIYQIGNGGLQCVYHDEKHRNMGDPETLRYFVDYSREYFPAEEYALILWDHGGGSLGGICHDMNYNDLLSMPELDKALRDSSLADQKLSMIGFDACMMGSGEVAQTVLPYADYMVASEEVEPGIGWNYAFLGTIKNDANILEVCTSVVDLYIKSCEELAKKSGSSAMLTISCIDLAKFDELQKAVEDFFLGMNLGEDNYIQASRARRKITAFGRNEEQPDNDYDLVDLGDTVRHLMSYGEEEKAKRVLTALEECVILSKTTKEDHNSTGLTVYFPYYNKKLYTASRDYYSSLSLSENYSAAVHSFGDKLVGSTEEQMGPVNNVQIGDGHRDNRTIVQLKLEEEQAKLADVAEIIALQRPDQEGGWRLVATQQAGINESGMATGEYVHTNLFVTGEDGNPLYDEPLLYVERDDGLYSVPVILTDAEQNDTSARLICKRNLGSYQLIVTDVYLFDVATNSYSSRFTGDLADYVSARYTVEEKMPAYYNDQEGSPLRPLEQWETVKTYERSWDLTEGWSLNFVRDYLDTKTISVLFRITDVYNNVYLSNPVPILGDEKSIQLTYDDNMRVLIDQESVNLTPNGMLFMRVQNTGSVEAKMWISDLKINGTDRDTETQITGFGENEGLEPEEVQLALVELPLNEGENVQELDFQISIQSIGEDEVEKVEVKISVGSGVW